MGCEHLDDKWTDSQTNVQLSLFSITHKQSGASPRCRGSSVCSRTRLDLVSFSLGWQYTLLTSFCPRSVFVPVLARLLAGPLSSAAGCPLLVPACCPPGRGASRDGVGKSLWRISTEVKGNSPQTWLWIRAYGCGVGQSISVWAVYRVEIGGVLGSVPSYLA